MSTIIRPGIEPRKTQVKEDATSSSTLPGWAYTDEGVFVREREDIFFRSWIYAGSVHDLVKPGDYLTTKVVNENVMVIRGENGELRGFYNVCQHRGHELLKGVGHVASSIVCPYHGWSYSTDGRLRAAPNCQHIADFSKNDVRLKPVRLEVFADHFVFVNLEPEAPSMHELAGDFEDELRREVPDFARMRPMRVEGDSHYMSTINANWKAVVDNYLECYHCTIAHPAFADLLDLPKYHHEAHGWWSRQVAPLRRPDNTAYPVAPDSKVRQAYFYWLWPGLTFNVLPGDPSWLVLFDWQPRAAGVTTTVTHFYGPPGAVLDQQRMRYLDSVLGPEDQGLCESVQRGLSSRGYSAGRFIIDPSGFHKTEVLVHEFHRRVVESLGL